MVRLQRPRLLRKRRPENGESLLGYLLRMTELNYYDKMSWIFELAGIPTNSHHKAHNIILFQPFDLTRLSHLTATAVETLQSMQYLPTGEKGIHTFKGHPVIRKSMIHSLKPRICPICIKENGFINAAWELALITCCPIHNCLLVDTCSGCNKKLTWSRKKVSECKCGYNLSAIEPKHVQREDAQLAAHLFLLLGLHDRDFFPLEGPLFEITLFDMFRILALFCNDFEKGSINSFSQFYPNNFSISKIHPRLIRAVNIFLDWPTNFHKFLKHTKFKPPKNNRFEFGLYRDFGIFYDRLFNSGMSHFQFLTDAFVQYVENNHSNGYITRSRLFKKRRFDNRYVNMKEATELLNTTEKWIERLIRSSVLKGSKIRHGNRYRYEIERVSLEQLVQKFKNTISLREAANLLGLYSGTVTNLVNSGLIEVVRGPSIDGYPRIRILRSSVINLLAAIGAKSNKKGFSKKGQLIDFSKVIRALNRVGYTVHEIITAILADQITPLGKTEGKGLYAYLYSATQIQGYMRGIIDKIKDEDINIREFAQKNCYDEDAIYFLVNRQFIETYYSGKPIVGRLLSRSAINRFNTEYVFSSEIAAVRNVNPGTVLSFLNKYGIQPVSGPRVDGGIKYLYRRKDLENLDLRQIKPSLRAREKNPS